MKTGMVQIVIKAPNQMIDDQIIECDRLWTINQLKQHLSKEYPTHPNTENQKLIYSGKLLSDELLLTDVLKTYGGHEYNTIHLVCSIRENLIHTKVVPQVVQQTPQPTLVNPPAVNAEQAPLYWVPPHQTTDAIRRNVPRNYEESARDDSNSNRQANNRLLYLQLQQQQMQQIQQVYIQYMAQYLQMANNGRLNMTVRNNNPTVNEETVHEVPQNQVNGDAEMEDEAGPQRDWLEWMYIATRLIVLFSVVYFYSSPLRFIVVMTMAFLLFNMDVERWRRRHEDAVPDAAAGQRQQQQQLQQPGVGGGNNNEVDNNGQQNNNNDGGTTNVSQQQSIENPLQQQRQNPHALHIVSTFITSFFLSLIPEQRAV